MVRLGSTWFDYAHQPTLTNRRSPTDAHQPTLTNRRSPADAHQPTLASTG
ncbi:MAG TPA: hypothetical protein VFC92_11695 [Bacteroidales bacterium]|nr:hypothetical protein [Bacteroidales bacterium]